MYDVPMRVVWGVPKEHMACSYACDVLFPGVRGDWPHPGVARVLPLTNNQVLDGFTVNGGDTLELQLFGCWALLSCRLGLALQ